MTSVSVWTLEMDAAAVKREPWDPARLPDLAVAGDPDAFEQLVRLHQQRVFRLAGRFFRTREDIEDVAQETFLQAWRRLETYRAKAPFEHWLTRVCLRCCYARLRKKRAPQIPLEGIDIQGRPADPAAGLEVERLLARLTPDDRFVLLLLDGEGWSIQEIARRIGWTAVKVKVRAHRARKRLRKVLEAGS